MGVDCLEAGNLRSELAVGTELIALANDGAAAATLPIAGDGFSEAVIDFLESSDWGVLEGAPLFETGVPAALKSPPPSDRLPILTLPDTGGLI